jgi:guanylate kinase
MKEPKDRILVALVGQSGSGKSTLMRAIARLLPQQTQVVRTILSRPPREDWEPEVFIFTSEASILTLDALGLLIQCTRFAGNLYALEKIEAEAATNDTVGLICLLPETVLELRQAGYAVRAVRIHTDRAPDIRGEPSRDTEEPARQNLSLDYDLVIFNSFAPGGLERSIVLLADYILTLAP